MGLLEKNWSCRPVHPSHHPSALNHAPVVVSIRAVSHLASLSCPPDIPNTSATTLPSHLIVFLLHLGPRRRCLPRCPHFPCVRSQSFGIPKGEYDRANVLFSLPLESFTNSAATPGASRSQVCAFYNMACTLLTLIVQHTVRARCLTALQDLPPHHCRHHRHPYTSMTTFSRFSAYSEVSTT